MWWKKDTDTAFQTHLKINDVIVWESCPPLCGRVSFKRSWKGTARPLYFSDISAIPVQFVKSYEDFAGVAETIALTHSLDLEPITVDDRPGFKFVRSR